MAPDRIEHIIEAERAEGKFRSSALSSSRRLEQHASGSSERSGYAGAIEMRPKRDELPSGPRKTVKSGYSGSNNLPVASSRWGAKSPRASSPPTPRVIDEQPAKRPRYDTNGTTSASAIDVDGPAAITGTAPAPATANGWGRRPIAQQESDLKEKARRSFHQKSSPERKTSIPTGPRPRDQSAGPSLLSRIGPAPDLPQKPAEKPAEEPRKPSEPPSGPKVRPGYTIC